jgi:hypothetical protein
LANPNTSLFNNISDHPTADWTAQQLRNAFPDHLARLTADFFFLHRLFAHRLLPVVEPLLDQEGSTRQANDLT